jgi:hypothetical protein
MRRPNSYQGGKSMLLDLLNKASNVAMLSFVVSSMLAMGSGLLLKVVEMVIVVAIVGLVTIMPLARVLAKQGSRDLTTAGAPIS